MRLKIVLHIKLQFVSSDLMVVNKTHFKRQMDTLSFSLPPCGHFLQLQGWSGNEKGVQNIFLLPSYNIPDILEPDTDTCEVRIIYSCY